MGAIQVVSSRKNAKTLTHGRKAVRPERRLAVDRDWGYDPRSVFYLSLTILTLLD